MRLYRVSFVCGLAAGYVLGARGGREHYDRMAKLARQVVGHPAAQQAMGAVQAQAAKLAKTGADAAKTQVRARTSGLTQSMMSRARSARPGSGRHETGGNGSASGGPAADVLDGSYHQHLN